VVGVDHVGLDLDRAVSLVPDLQLGFAFNLGCASDSELVERVRIGPNPSDGRDRGNGLSPDAGCGLTDDRRSSARGGVKKKEMEEGRRGSGFECDGGGGTRKERDRKTKDVRAIADEKGLLHRVVKTGKEEIFAVRFSRGNCAKLGRRTGYRSRPERTQRGKRQKRKKKNQQLRD
jgi:hypothetical protein